MSTLQAAIDAVMAETWSGTTAQLAALERLVTEARKVAQPAEPVAWLHKYRHKQGGRRYQQAEVGDATDPPHRHPEPQEGFEWIGREPLYAAPQVPQPERVPLPDMRTCR